MLRPKKRNNFKKEYFSCQLLSFNFVMKPKILGMVFLKRNKKTLNLPTMSFKSSKLCQGTLQGNQISEPLRF